MNAWKCIDGHRDHFPSIAGISQSGKRASHPYKMLRLNQGKETGRLLHGRSAPQTGAPAIEPDGNEITSGCRDGVVPDKTAAENGDAEKGMGRSEWIDEDSLLPPHPDFGTGPGQPVPSTPKNEQSGKDQTHAGQCASLVCPTDSQDEHEGCCEQADNSQDHVENQQSGCRRFPGRSRRLNHFALSGCFITRSGGFLFCHLSSPPGFK
jgi:hypothetical protein